MDEEALRQRFVDGDRSAFEALAAPHLDTLYTACLRLTNARPDAEELAQTALLQAFVRRHRYDPKRPFRPGCSRSV